MHRMIDCITWATTTAATSCCMHKQVVALTAAGNGAQVRAYDTGHHICEPTAFAATFSAADCLPAAGSSSSWLEISFGSICTHA